MEKTGLSISRYVVNVFYKQSKNYTILLQMTSHSTMYAGGQWGKTLKSQAIISTLWLNKDSGCLPDPIPLGRWKLHSLFADSKNTKHFFFFLNQVEWISLSVGNNFVKRFCREQVKKKQTC